jgi:hypothetical protein
MVSMVHLVLCVLQIGSTQRQTRVVDDGINGSTMWCVVRKPVHAHQSTNESQCAICRPPSADRRPPSAVRRLPSAVCRLPSLPHEHAKQIDPRIDDCLSG